MNTPDYTKQGEGVPVIENLFTDSEIAGMVEGLFDHRRTLLEGWETYKDKWTESPDGTRSITLDGGMKIVIETVKKKQCTCCG